MIRWLLVLLTLPAHAGIILFEEPAKDRRWVYDDGFIEVVLSDKQEPHCNGMRSLYVLSGSNHKIDGCWEEVDTLVHVKYDSGYRFVIKAHKFKEVKINTAQILK
jgi:hypothetical protein